ncbi:MAG: ATP-binding protein [Planctomycetota bacterium]
MKSTNRGKEFGFMAGAYGSLKSVPLLGKLIGEGLLDIVAIGYSKLGAASGIFQNDGKVFPAKEGRFGLPPNGRVGLLKKYCQAIRSTDKGKMRCMASDCQAVKKFTGGNRVNVGPALEKVMKKFPIEPVRDIKLGKRKVRCYKCHAGLLELVRSISIDMEGKRRMPVGAIWAGQNKVYRKCYTLNQVRKLAREIDYPKPENLVTLWRLIPWIGEKELGNRAKSLADTADSIEDSALAVFRSKQQRDQLKQKDRQNRELFQDIAHQVFRPLMQLKQFALILRNSPSKDAYRSFRECLKEYERACRNFVLYEELTIGLGAKERAKFDIVKMVDKARSRVEPYLEAESKELVIRRKPARRHPIPQLAGNAEGILESLVNVLHNAIMYSIGNDPVEVEIAYRQDSKRVEIRVVNCGVEIPKKDRERIFKRAVRAETAKAVPIEGSGIGLYISRRMIELNRGSIRVESSTETEPTKRGTRRWRTAFLICLQR